MRFSPRQKKLQKKISTAEKIPENIRSGQSRNSRVAGVNALKAANPNKIINDRKKSNDLMKKQTEKLNQKISIRRRRLFCRKNEYVFVPLI